MSEPFDGINWTCVKCGTTFDLLKAHDYHCPQCQKQVEGKELRKRPVRLACSFQTMRFNGGYKGLGCQLTNYGVGAGDFVFGVVDHSLYMSPCIMEKCPIYQTWKLLEKREPSLHKL